MVFIDCDDVREAWYNEHPDLDMQLEKLKTQGIIKGYKTTYKQTKRTEQ